MMEEVYSSSGNIFADLGFPNSEEMLLKAKLTKKINEIISSKQLTQPELSTLLNIDPVQLISLERGRLTDVSLESLLKFLNILGQDIEITVRTATSDYSQGKILLNV